METPGQFLARVMTEAALHTAQLAALSPDAMGAYVAEEVIKYIDMMYPGMWEGVSQWDARASLRVVIARHVVTAVELARAHREDSA